MKIAYLGNFSVPWCTENDIAWSFEHIGHEVVKLQENEATTDEILVAALTSDLFLWTRTHGWGSQIDGEKVINTLKVNGIISASFHLDKFFGLDRLDRRESLIGVHPWWHTDYVFTADGGHQQEFKDRGVNHQWIEPGVVERDCYLGTPRPEWQIDVAFVGSENYHPEYPERGALIQWLKNTYGNRFRRFAGDVVPPGTVRGKDLNDLYASIKVVVGDSCFAGAPFYWSDRVPETIGRGGFLIHPASDGLAIDGLVTYTTRDIAYLKKTIDYYLDHEAERLQLRDMAFEDVKANHTYTNRVRTMLSVMGFEDA